ncbi:hypothetical protein VSH64_11315 [Amycolatopsis rhabdoformis]|uniref:Single-stranded DNA-binding protein n=1 Tax=Amycolatopsis rhabdoformis TaxID=1448059 RepID=A0ABZ1IF16_9PSEU|nr:hypothetical protein [Amycolatopsis rhabdoformis]WSE32691.1 hypothetical protein VSH64_11315 [Amycolatopsis rhabdoformis]
MIGTTGLVAGPRVVVTGVLEVRAAQDGRLDLAVTRDRSKDCVALDLAPGLTADARAAVLRRVTVGGRLRRSGDRWVLHAEWLRLAHVPGPR